MSRALGLAGALALAACSRPAPPALPAPLSALLITLDTTRADALSSYGERTGTTPNLDRLAARGVLFENAHTVAPITLPAHASMLTGLVPPRHSVRENGLWALPAEARTLAEEARAAGVQTAAFVGAVVLDRSFGLDQGFETYDAPPRAVSRTTSNAEERSDAGTVSAALAWLERRDRSRPFFLWVHLFAPHQPYAPPPELAGGTDDEALYLGEVAAMDRELGRLVEALERDGAQAAATVLVVGDHGEALHEHGEPTHGVFCYEATLRVPLLLVVPGRTSAGTRSSAVVSVVDVHPTLLDALGLPVREAVDGVSLLRASPAGRGVYFESFQGYLAYGWSPLAGWIDGTGKYLHSSMPEYFDLTSDPGETHDLVASRAAQAQAARTAIAALLARPSIEPAAGSAVSAELRAGVQRLGYAAAGSAETRLPHPLAPSSLPSPTTRREEYLAGLNALDLLNVGRLEEAVPILQALLRGNPGSWFALDRLGFALLQLGRPAEALEPLRRLCEGGGPQWPAAWFCYGRALGDVGEREAAARAYLRARDLDPAVANSLAAVVDWLRQSGRADEAAFYEARFLAPASR
jgi:arylsulfatase A-like enzyme